MDYRIDSRTVLIDGHYYSEKALLSNGLAACFECGRIQRKTNRICDRCQEILDYQELGYKRFQDARHNNRKELKKFLSFFNAKRHLLEMELLEDGIKIKAIRQSSGRLVDSVTLKNVF